MRTGMKLDRLRMAALALLLVALELAPGASAAFAGRLNQMLGGFGASSQSSRVIVTGDSCPVVSRCVARVGGVVSGSLPTINAVVADVPQRSLTLLASDPAIRSVEPDEILLPSGVDLVTKTVGAAEAWKEEGVTGRGVTVAVLDSGIAPHPDLAGRVVGWADLINGRPYPYDDYGHGTHVAGIVAGAAHSSHGRAERGPYTGVAPGASIVGIKILNGRGLGRVSTAIAGIGWCIAHQREYHIRILNLSLGHKPSESYQFDPLCQACEQAERSGLIVVTAAGNAGRIGYQTIDSPGDDPMVLTVGSTNMMDTPTRDDDRVSSYSGRGPTLFDHVLKPDLLAPGNRIVSLRAVGSYLDLNYPSLVVSTSRDEPGAYFRLSGTSMAAAVASGAAALLLEESPQDTPGLLKARLMVSATHWANNLRGLLATGSGYLDIPAALETREPENAAAWTSFAMSPLLSPVPSSGGVRVFNGTGANWSFNLICGSHTLWGAPEGDDGLLSATNTMWGDDTAAAFGAPTVWGESPTAAADGSVSALNTMWGDDAFWSDALGVANTMWGDDLYVDPNTLGPFPGGTNAVWGNDLIWTSPSLAGVVSAYNTMWGDDDAPPPD